MCITRTKIIDDTVKLCLADEEYLKVFVTHFYRHFDDTEMLVDYAIRNPKDTRELTRNPR